MAKKKTLDEVYFTMDSGSLIGLSNHLKDYQIAYHLNKLLSIELEREKDFNYYNPKKGKTKTETHSLFSLESQNTNETPYALYACVDEAKHLMYILLNTHSNGVILHETFKAFDRLLLIFGRDHLDASQKLCSLQKEIPSTLLIQHFNFTSVQKNKQLLKTFDFLNNELLPEIEMYFIEMVSEKEKSKSIII